MKQNLLKTFKLRVLMLVALLCTGFTSAWGDEVTDVINRDVTSSLIGSTGSTAWTDITVTCTSGAEYVIHTMGVSNTPSYGIRWNKNGYLYATKSGGKVKSITITGDSKKVDIYASNSSYSAKATATKVGSLTISSEGATYTFGSEQDYTFVAINGTTTSTNISSIQITWETASSASPSIDASDVNIAYDATSGSLAYTINNPSSESLTASTTSDWLTLGTVGASPIAFTCSANPGKTSRTATVTLTYGSVTKNVTVTQAGNPNIVDNISDINAAGTYNVRGTIVAKSQRGFIVGDGTGYVYYYNNDYTQADYNIGDKVQLSGSVVVYGGVFEFNNSTTITAATESNYVAEEPTVLTGAQMDTRVGSTTPTQLSSYVQYEGVLSVSVTANGTFYNITNIDGASTAKGSISYPLTTDFASLNGKLVKVTGYYVGVSSSQYYNTMIGSIEEVVSTTPIINLTSEAEIELAYDATSGSIEYSITNPTDDVNLIATTSDSWISNITVGADAVTFTTEANEGTTDRTATITLSYTGAQTVEVTVTQKHFVADYATLPFEFNGGKADIANTAGLTQSGLDDDYSSAPKLKFDGTDDELVLKFNERPGTLTFDIKGNSFSGGTFKVQTSADGVTYTDLETYTEITGTQNEEFKNLGENVRYIKWIYTNKSSGNVGLGNIKLTKYVAPANYDLTVALNNGISAIFVYNTADENNPLIAEGAAGTVQVTDGTEIMVSPDVAEGYVLESLMVDGVDVTSQIDNSGAYTFAMPNHAVAISATATESSVTPGSDEEWVLTSLADLTSSDIFVIVGNNGDNYAMTNANGTSSAPGATAITIENDKITSAVAANIQWTISGNVTDGYTFYPNGTTETWLYCTNTNNGVRVGTNENNFFKVSNEGYLLNDATSRYVGIYNSQDWRCYTSINDNIKEQTFSFYKKVEATPEPYTRTKPTSSVYGTLCLPYDATITGGTLYNIASASFTVPNTPSTLQSITLVEVGTEAEAGKGYIIKFSADEMTATFTSTNEVSTPIANNGLIGNPTTEGKTVKAGESNFVLQAGKLRYCNDKAATNGGYRAYIDASQIVNHEVPAGVKSINLFLNGVDAIDGINSEIEDAEIYNIAGQRMNKLQRGVNIVNGKKVLVK